VGDPRVRVAASTRRRFRDATTQDALSTSAAEEGWRREAAADRGNGRASSSRPQRGQALAG
jgi:hypothetical protein